MPLGHSLFQRLLPPIAIVCVVFLVVGVAIPVLPLHIHKNLGMSTFIVGVVAGGQFFATLLSRLWAGGYTDRHGARKALEAGLLVAAASGGFYLASLQLLRWPIFSVCLLLIGRIILGVAESFVIAGALNLALTIAGPEHSGRAMSLVGTAMYIAYAIAAPLGSYLYISYGFFGAGLVTFLLPSLAWCAVRRIRSSSSAPIGTQGLAVRHVLLAVWLPGLGLAMSGVGFSTLGTFASLWVSEKGWGQPWLAFTAFSLVFVATRMAGGRLPDRMGGARVAAVSALVEALGQLFMGVALDEDTLVAGAVLTGMGYALVFPGLGLVALRAIQPQSRALAMGTYTAFLDLTLAFSIPLLGWLAEYAGLQSVFLVASLCALASALVSFGIAVRSAKSTA